MSVAFRNSFHAGELVQYLFMIARPEAQKKILGKSSPIHTRVSDQLSAACIIRHSHMEKKQWQKLGNTTEM